MALNTLGQGRMQDGATAESEGTALFVGGKAGAIIQPAGTWAGTITMEATLDGRNWHNVDALNLENGTRDHQISAKGLYWVPTFGAELLRANITTYTSGNVIVHGKAVNLPVNGLPA